MPLTRDNLRPNRPVSMRKDGDILNPPHVESLTANAVSQDERLTDDCGRSETRTTSEGMWQLDIGGILLEPDRKLLVEMGLRNAEVTITNPAVPQTSFIVKDITLDFQTEMATARFPNREVTDATRRLANNPDLLTESPYCKFTLQTKEPDNEAL